MKKLISLCCVLALTLSLTSCGLFGGDDGNEQSKNAEQAKMSPEEDTIVWTQELLTGYLNSESDAEMSYAGPFYFGSFDGALAFSQEYSTLRREKVSEILTVVDEGIDKLGELDKKLREEKEIFTWYIGEIQTIDESTKEYTNQILTATDLNSLTSALSTLMVMRKTGATMEEGPEWGFLQFQKYAGFVQLTNLYSAETSSLMIRSIALYYLLEADSNTAYQDLNKEFTKKMDPVSEGASELLNELYYKAALANYGDTLVFTTDYLYSKKAVEAIDKRIAEAQKAIDDYNGKNELVGDEMLALLKTKLKDLEDYKTQINEYLDSIPDEELLSASELAYVENAGGYRSDNLALIPIVAAGPPPQTDIFSSLKSKLDTTIDLVKMAPGMTIAIVKMGGEKMKDIYDKSGAHEVVKDGAQIINTGIEAASSGMEITMTGIQDIYWGDFSWKKFNRKIESEKEELYDKFVKGTLGKEQMDEMIRQLDQFKATTERQIESMSGLAGDLTGFVTGQKKVGEFVRKVTKGVANEAKGALDTATDFSRNLAIALHPETTKQQTREALLGILTSLKGIRDDEGKLKKVGLPDLVELTKEEMKKELGLSEEEEKEFLEILEEKLIEELGSEESGKEESGDGTKKDEPNKDSSEEDGSEEGDGADSGTDESDTTEEGDSNTSDSGEGTSDTTTGSADTTTAGSTGEKDAIDEILTNPNLSDEEIREKILAEIMRGLPPISEKNKDKEDDPNDKDYDKDGVEDGDDNCIGTKNADQADTDGDGLGDICDPDCSGDKDADTVCDELDNCPSDANTDQADGNHDGEGNVCDDDAPALSELSGSWPGTVTVTEVIMTDEFRTQAAASGCDISQVEEAKGQAKPVTFTITSTSENGGTLLMAGPDVDPKEIPFTYENGQLDASYHEEELDVEFHMTFSGTTSTGTMSADYLDGNLKIEGELDLAR